ncbi:hypothetical protein C2E20_6826 [Micractinium conductrix]|nr:hypothetical protein C2E20_6826 [Micractinium conductrix]|eukprot:PSC69618.1 hypothetical protein C2E20_6826 [Micractinium conductrix]
MLRSAAPTATAGSYSGAAPACSAATAKAPACTGPLAPLRSISPRPKTASPRPKSAASVAAGGKPAGAADVGTDGVTPPALKLQQRVVTLQQLLEDGVLEGEDSIPAVHEAATPDEAKPVAQGGVPPQQAQRAAGDHVLLNPAFQGLDPAGDLPGFRLELLTLLEERCEAVEAHCAALTGSRAALARELVERTAAALGGGATSGTAAQQQAEALGALRSEFEARLAEADGRLGNAVRAVAAECRVAVAAVGERQRAQEAALRGEMKSMNEALLAIARRVGSMVQGQAAQK